VRLSNSPTLRSGRNESLRSPAYQASRPTFPSSGPLVRDRLFLEQNIQYRYSTDDVASRPEDELRTQ
jgi:hypothetical protein